jgi:hypothetical protein
MRVELDTYTFVLLRRGPRAHEFSDDGLREGDPAIQVGRMAVEAMRWLTRKGALV